MPRFIGDSVMIHQALEPLRAAGMPLVAWGPGQVAELFRGSAAFQGVWADGPERSRPLALRRLLLEHRAAAVVNLPRSTRALLAAWLARIPVRAGWQGGGGALLATASLPFQTEGHQLDRYRRLLALAFPGLPEAQAPPFRPRPEALAEAEACLAAHGLTEPFVVLGLGAMSPNKRLGTGVWVELVGRLRSRGLRHVLVGGPGEDVTQAAAILARVPGVPDLTGRLPLSTTAGLIAMAAGLVGNDSALGHLGAACGIPVVSVFGPTLPRATAPVGRAVTVVRREDLGCLECGVFDCPVPGHPCMEAVAAAALEDALVRNL